MKARRLVFVIGDSIAAQYCEYLKPLLAGRYRVARRTGREAAVRRDPLAGDAGRRDSAAVRAYLAAMIAGFVSGLTAAAGRC